MMIAGHDLENVFACIQISIRSSPVFPIRFNPINIISFQFMTIQIFLRCRHLHAGKLNAKIVMLIIKNKFCNTLMSFLMENLLSSFWFIPMSGSLLFTANRVRTGWVFALLTRSDCGSKNEKPSWSENTIIPLLARWELPE